MTNLLEKLPYMLEAFKIDQFLTQLTVFLTTEHCSAFWEQLGSDPPKLFCDSMETFSPAPTSNETAS